MDVLGFKLDWSKCLKYPHHLWDNTIHVLAAGYNVLLLDIIAALVKSHF